MAVQTQGGVGLRAGKSHDEQSRYLLAQCCMRMGKLTEAEQALLPSEADFGGVRCLLAGRHSSVPCLCDGCCSRQGTAGW